MSVGASYLVLCASVFLSVKWAPRVLVRWLSDRVLARDTVPASCFTHFCFSSGRLSLPLSLGLPQNHNVVCWTLRQPHPLGPWAAFSVRECTCPCPIPHSPRACAKTAVRTTSEDVPESWPLPAPAPGSPRGSRPLRGWVECPEPLLKPVYCPSSGTHFLS